MSAQKAENKAFGLTHTESKICKICSQIVCITLDYRLLHKSSTHIIMTGRFDIHNPHPLTITSSYPLKEGFAHATIAVQ